MGRFFFANNSLCIQQNAVLMFLFVYMQNGSVKTARPVANRALLKNYSDNLPNMIPKNQIVAFRNVRFLNSELSIIVFGIVMI